ncbi:general secretion pathway protein GspK [Pseudomonas sp. LS-2]|jgi:general secretion pathway protein K|uniref:general secretion pathway protein GspK n=1 Tax=Pseudomonas sp. LS-2 TaxID=2315859 RepID=UPI000E7181E3|nr:general secretion pathway protein GspK [Pseudomonas sp. LS-2]RJX77391.1 general secretion pathway protein GspK [Pseudomonas sp. LS-2]
MRGQRGVALLLVLWVLALLGTLLAGLLGWVHLQNRQALWQRQHTQAVLAAEAGVGMAVLAQLDRDPKRHWKADGQPHALPFDEATLAVSLTSEAGKLDVNAAPVESLARLVMACGGSPAQSAQLSQALNQRRGGDRAPLRTIEELRELPAMDQRLYTCVSAHMTLWSGLPAPDAGLASPWLRRVLNLPQGGVTANDAGPVITVQSRATLPGGFGTTLSVTLLLNPSKEGVRPYRVLRWQE